MTWRRGDLAVMRRPDGSATGEVIVLEAERGIVTVGWVPADLWQLYSIDVPARLLEKVGKIGASDVERAIKARELFYEAE